MLVAQRNRRAGLPRGHDVTNISSLAELDEFLSNPSPDAMVFNLYGELAPIPPSSGNWWKHTTILSSN